MFTCHICQFDTEQDDVAVPVQGDRCICLRCYARETHSAKPMSKILRRQVSSALAAIAEGRREPASNREPARAYAPRSDPTMILAYRIPELSERMRAATLRANRRHADDAAVHQMIDHLERRGYRVTRADRAA
jgi:hypothetical protein